MKARECSIRHREVGGCSNSASSKRIIAISILIDFFYYEGKRADMSKERVDGEGPR